MKKIEENKQAKENVPKPDSKNKRRWLRFEFTSPILFRLISLEEGSQELEANLERDGQILDISAGGALLATSKPVTEGNFISLNLNLKGLKVVKGILGKVKRVEESDQGDFLMGIEFCSLETCPDVYQQALSKKDIQGFDRKIKQAISAFILSKEKDRVKV
jgi:hypothetical protein